MFWKIQFKRNYAGPVPLFLVGENGGQNWDLKKVVKITFFPLDRRPSYQNHLKCFEYCPLLQLITSLKNDILPKIGGVLKNSQKNLNAHVKTKSCLLLERLCDSKFKKGSQNQFFPIVWETQLPISIFEQVSQQCPKYCPLWDSS